MAVNNMITVTLAGTGGTLPYTFQVVADAETTIAASISGNQLTVDGTSYAPGVYGVHVRIIDANGRFVDKVITVFAADPTVFTILNDNYVYQPGVFPIDVSQPLRSAGGVGTISWSLIAGVTNAPGASINSNNDLVFQIDSLGEWTVGVTATDSIGNQVAKVFTIAAQNSPAFSMVDGQVEVLVNVPNTDTGNHNFTLTVGDSTGVASIRKTFSYKANPQLMTVDFSESYVDYIWGTGDTTTIVLPIQGDLTGFVLGTSASSISGNGLTATLDENTNTVAFSGPPSSFGNSEVFVPIGVLHGSSQVATITREFTLLSHSGTTSLGDVTCTTRPYSVGDLVGLNPIKPFYNSPHYSKPASYTVSVAAGSALPDGLSLDANTALIYGTITAANVAQSVLNYIDSTGVTQGTVTINWDIQVSNFQVTDNTTVGQIQVPYTGSLANNGVSPLSTVTLYRGRLPQGLTAIVDSTGANISIVGTPEEAGFFDVWFIVTNQSQQKALVYKRFAVSYIQPLVILTTGLNQIITGSSYAQFLNGFGGTTPYTWAITAGTLPTGISFNTVTGELSGTTSVSSYNQNITFTLTDSRGAVATSTLALEVNSALEVETTTLPLVTPSQYYSYQLSASGGSTPYTWSLATGSPALPGGISISSSGLISGATSVESYTNSIIVKVTDANNNTATASLLLQIGVTSEILIDSSGVGSIPRGGPYHGLLRTYGSGVAPFVWSVASNTPNPLPAGISLSTDTSSQGVTATLSGSTTATFTNLSVKVQVVDSNGNFAVAYILLSSYSTLAITTNSLPTGVVGGTYSVQLAEAGAVGSYTWSVDGTSAPLPSGYSLSPNGILSGVTGSVYSGNLVFDLVDSIGDSVYKTFNLSVITSNLTDTTTSLPPVIIGVAYSANLTASGGTTPYVWSLAPTSPALPSGISLDPNAGVLSGTTVNPSTGTINLIIRLGDATGFYVDKTLALQVVVGTTLSTGVDYTDGLSTNYLGYVVGGDVTSINPRPNYSFEVIATNVVSTNINQMTVTVPTGFTATVQSIFTNSSSVREAIITLSGPFNAGVIGDNNFPITVVDSGATVSAIFKWRVLASPTLSLYTSSGSFPVIYLD